MLLMVKKDGEKTMNVNSKVDKERTAFLLRYSDDGDDDGGGDSTRHHLSARRRDTVAEQMLNIRIERRVDSAVVLVRADRRERSDADFSS